TTRADGFAVTRQAEAPVSGRAPAAHPGARPLEPNKPSLRLKLDSADPSYETRAVRVPKRRAPLLLGLLIVLAMLGGGAFLWLDAHGGVDNFLAQLRHLSDGAAPASGTIQQPPAAQAPGTQPSTPAAPPAEQGQIATGEVEEPAAAAPPEAKPTPPPVAAPKPAKPARPSAPREPVVKRAPVRREPVIRIQPLGESNVLQAAPPDPSGAPVLPPPDPPAPE
ncbi:MAG TPA: hypothetical protein VJR89_31310, partial [Polyangiales bacterium]|nr:hypothetical protein [Polyangiales bacterium]